MVMRYQISNIKYSAAGKVSACSHYPMIACLALSRLLLNFRRPNALPDSIFLLRGRQLIVTGFNSNLARIQDAATLGTAFNKFSGSFRLFAWFLLYTHILELLMVNNKSIKNPKTWTDGDLKFTEIIGQEYTGNNCKFSAGFVEGHPVDTMYLQLEKDGEVSTQLLLRPDEMAAIAWVATGSLWSELMDKK